VRQAYSNLVDYLKTQALVPGELVIHSLAGSNDKTEVAFRLHRDSAGLDWIAVSAVPRSDFLGSVTGGVTKPCCWGLLPYA